jgi:hypothetical protein
MNDATSPDAAEEEDPPQASSWWHQHQYEQLSESSWTFFLCHILGWVVHLLIIFIVWVYGWRLAGASWLRVSPAIVYGALAAIEIFVVLILGPVVWGDSCSGQVAIFMHVAVFAWISCYPLVLDAADRPCKSTLAQLAAAGLMVFLSIPYVNVRLSLRMLRRCREPCCHGGMSLHRPPAPMRPCKCC